MSPACRCWSGWRSLLTIVFGWVARFTRTGRNLYALGSNPGERALRRHQRGLALGAACSSSPALLCGFVGVLWGARFGTVDAVLAPDLHLQAISAVVVGGVSIFGGSGSVYGAAHRRGDLRGAAERRAAARNQPVLAAGGDGAAILGTVIFYSLLARRAERAEREARRQPVGLGLASART